MRRLARHMGQTGMMKVGSRHGTGYRGRYPQKQGISLAQPLWQAEQIRKMEECWAEREAALYVLSAPGAALCNYARHHCPRVTTGGFSSARVTTGEMAMSCPPRPPTRPRALVIATQRACSEATPGGPPTSGWRRGG